MELRAWVSGLEHVPVGVDKIAHPKAVVSTVHHVAALEPECAVGIARWIRAPKVITCGEKSVVYKFSMTSLMLVSTVLQIKHTYRHGLEIWPGCRET